MDTETWSEKLTGPVAGSWAKNGWGKDKDFIAGHATRLPIPTPVHIAVDIVDNTTTNLGYAGVDYTALSKRPSLNPGMQVTQMTISGCPRPGTSDVSVRFHAAVAYSVLPE